MIQFPHAKINLGLSVISRRPDGFHDIETIFYPVPLYDVLEIVPAAETSLKITGLPVPGRTEDNLLLRAWQLVKAKRPFLPPLEILLHKNIPMGAGLGGGSSDAARFLIMMNSFFTLGLSESDLVAMASGLGSDCAFFLHNHSCIGTARGEKLEPVALDLSGYDLLLVHPGLAVSTAWAYGQIKPGAPRVPMKTLAALSPEKWKGSMFNDFEVPVFAAYPELAGIRNSLYGAGAVYAAMTGSGSTLFGLFAAGTCPDNAVDSHWFSRRLPAAAGSAIW